MLVIGMINAKFLMAATLLTFTVSAHEGENIGILVKHDKRVIEVIFYP